MDQVNPEGRTLLETEITDDNSIPPKYSSLLVEVSANYNYVSGNNFTNPSMARLSDGEVKKQLQQLHAGCREINSYASEYDYSSSVQYNGFRTFLKIVKIFFGELFLHSKLVHSGLGLTKTAKSIERIDSLLDFLPLLIHQLVALQLIRLQKSVQSEQNDELKVAQVKDETLPLELEILIHQMKLTTKDMEPFYSKKSFAFWVSPGIRRYRRFTDRMLLSLFLYPISQILESVKKKQADRSVNSWIAELKKEQKLVKRFMTLKPTSNMIVTEFKLTARQNKWIIDKHSATVMEGVLTNESIQPAPVRLVIVKPKKRTTDNIIYHIHGGSWALLSPEGYFKVHDRWIKDIGATIVSIDYSLSPQNKYPVALQEVVDAYVWLAEASALKMNLSPLGFAPKDIVVQGDSAGGNLTMALAVVLAEIKKKSPEAIKLPKAFAPQYPVASPGVPYITASSTLQDVVLVPCNRAKFCTLYYGEDPADIDISYLNGKNDPWFKDEDKLKEVYTRVNGSKRTDAIFHITTYTSFDLLKEVPLYIQGSEFDPLLDDAVAIAKLWKGPVTFDVCEKVVHGFSMFITHCDECRKADQLVTQRLKEAVGPE